MISRIKCAGAAAVLGVLTTGQAVASVITVTIEPAAQIVNISDGSFTVELRADIPVEDEIRGWGLDFDIITPGIVGASTTFSLNAALFDSFSSPDGDDIGGLVPFADSALFGTDVLLGTMTMSIDGLGTTALSLTDDNPPPHTGGDLSEGFLLEPPPASEFADVVYVDGSVTVIPEPATLAALTLAAIGFIRRRR